MIRKIIFLLTFFLVSILTACNQQSESAGFPGYSEGQYTYVSAYTTGLLKSLSVKKGENIKEGQLLFTLSDQTLQYDVDTAKERVDQAKSQVTQSQKQYDLQKTYQRTASPYEKSINKNRTDEAYANLQAARNNLSALRATLNKAEWTAKQKEVRSPKAGIVFDIYYNPGELVQMGASVLSILDPKKTKIIFYIPEIVLPKIKLNQEIEINCDHCEKSIKGKIIFISPQSEYSPPVIYSTEARKKLVYRVEAEPLLDQTEFLLHPGQPVTVRVTAK